MTAAARERFHVRAPLLLISAAAWALLALEPHSTAMMVEEMAPNPPASLAAGWALMLAAMMTPLLIAPVRHIRERSFAGRRIRAITLFLAAYAAIWMAAGGVLLELALALRTTVPNSSVLLAAAIIMALVWQVSPAKQRCLNRSHSHPALAAFGSEADISALCFGLTHGIWCIGSCSVLMLVPLLVSGGHVAAMAVVALWLFAERLDSPAPPSWRFRGAGKAVRIAIAQTRTRPSRQRSGSR